MAAYRNKFDEMDNDDDRDDPLEGDQDSDDDYLDENYKLPEMLCPNCRRSVTEDTQKCPHCGDWITPVDASRRSPKRWLYVVVALIIVVLLVFTTFR